MDMRTNLSILAGAILAVLFCVSGCSTPAAQVSPNIDMNDSDLSNRVNAFAESFYNEITAHGLNENIVFSPVSLYLAFGSVYIGSNGKTSDELRDAFHFQNDHSRLSSSVFRYLSKRAGSGIEGNRLLIANGIWFQKGVALGNRYMNTIVNDFNADVHMLDFSQSVMASDNINGWVSEKTGGNVNSIVKPSDFSALTRLVLANAVYFKALWKDPFDEKATKSLPFYVDDKNVIQVPFMSRKAETGYVKTPMYESVEFDYSDGNASMVVVLPKDKNGLSMIEKAFIDGKLLAEMPAFEKKEMAVLFPKFQIEQEVDLKNVLSKMGVVEAFGYDADFSAMFDNGNELKDTAITRAVHKAFIEVEEKGTTAGAATAVVISKRSISRPLMFDHPFLFLIKDKLKSVILFAGCVRKP